jgi:viologen exporter family transport system permease protein
MLNALRLYGRYIGVSMRGQMQYRVSFVLQSLGQFLVNGIEFLATWALFHRFGSLGGWTLAEVAVLYGLVHTEWGITDATGRGLDLFGGMVKAGDFDRLLLRPRGAILQLMGQELTLRRIGRISQGLLVLAWGLYAAGVMLTPAKAMLLFATVAGGWCFFTGLLVLQATMCFWTTESLEVMNTLTYGGCETARYPMTIYGPRFRKLFTYVVPLACVTYFPATAIIGKPDPLGFPVWFPWAAPLLGPVFLLVALQVWRFGVRHYQSTGS